VRVSQLVRREATTHPGQRRCVMQVAANAGRRARPPTCPSA
jgi:hypothetical protein